jgi:hypothetical protein
VGRWSRSEDIVRKRAKLLPLATHLWSTRRRLTGAFLAVSIAPHRTDRDVPRRSENFVRREQPDAQGGRRR